MNFRKVISLFHSKKKDVLNIMKLDSDNDPNLDPDYLEYLLNTINLTIVPPGIMKTF